MTLGGLKDSAAICSAECLDKMEQSITQYKLANTDWLMFLTANVVLLSLFLLGSTIDKKIVPQEWQRYISVERMAIMIAFTLNVGMLFVHAVGG